MEEASERGSDSGRAQDAAYSIEKTLEEVMRNARLDTVGLAWRSAS